jgi:hypothetical protein
VAGERELDSEPMSVFSIRADRETMQGARVLVSRQMVTIELPGFRAELPRAATSARRLPDTPTPRGPAPALDDPTRWTYTTSTQGIVQLLIDPPADATVSIAISYRRIHVSSLLISVVQADELVGLLGGA